ncbi:MAG: RNA 2',3'-cyclic phosphodiesterase [Dehalococcoidia bacterium]|nr:RNA 2',3'-cyclic phosphodiesterase [Dehalococcoidia bacterium]
MAGDTLRAFVALPMPEPVQRYLLALQRRMENAAPGAIRWVDAEGMHLTLKFLGDVPKAQAPALAALVEQAATSAGPLRLPLTTVGCFPDPLRPRVIWVGLGGDLSRLQQLHQTLDAGLEELGFAPETRRFVAHPTLGRVRDAIPPDDLGSLRRMLQHPPVLTGAPPALVGRVVLYHSTLTQAGPVYRPLAAADLTGES